MKRALDARLAAGLAVLVLGGALAAILAFGQLRYPVFPSLVEQPDPSIPGSLAWVSHDEREHRPCLWVARASGEQPPRRLTCASDLGGPVTWREGRIEVGVATGTRVYDPASGRVVVERGAQGAELPGPPRPGAEPLPEPELDRALSPRGDRAVPVSENGRVRLWLERAGVRGALLADVQGPRDYSWWDVVWSPDGRHLAVHDAANRLLIVDVRERTVRLLAGTGGSATWGP